MKAYFTKLLNYDQFENHALLDGILATGNPPKAVKLMAHILAAQQVWLTRCNFEPATGVALWPDWPAAALGQIIDDNHRNWIDFIEQLTTDDLEKTILYKNFADNTYENKLVDILAHVVNHGTHHRAQVGQELKMAGLDKLPMTDYIFYIREQ